MKLTVSDCLVLKYDVWVSYDGKDYTTHIVPLECFGKDDIEHIDWDNNNPTIQKGWCFLWCDSGINYLTDNEWSDIFATEQEAFDNAYADLNDGEDDGGFEDLEWLAFARNNNLHHKVVTTAMNGYKVSDEVLDKLSSGDY